MSGWVDGLTVIIRLVSVQLALNSQLELSSAKNLNFSWDNIFWTKHFKLTKIQQQKENNFNGF